jgi:hypothetical protein
MGGQDLLWLGHKEAVCFNVEKQSNEFSSVWAEFAAFKDRYGHPKERKSF